MGFQPAQFLANAARRLDAMFPGYFQTSTKRDHYGDFGFPSTITFDQFWQMYMRNGIARAGVEKTVMKTWQDIPFLQEDDNPDNITTAEQEILDKFEALRFWQVIQEADRRSLVGDYGGLILRIADSKAMREPVDTAPGGLDALVEIIPAWQGQLQVAEWGSNELSDTYGKPTMFQFNESAVGGDTTKARQFQVHPDRVIVWSRDGTVHGSSLLSPGFNDLITIEKIVGGGGEGFWKNAKSAPVLSIDKDARIEDMAKAMGVSSAELADKMDEQVKDFNRGFDSMLMLMGIEAKPMNVSLPQPEQFLSGAIQSFAASINIPTKILVGMQTGERASTEDAKEWSQTIMSRRMNVIIPNIMDIVRRLEQFGILKKGPKWSLHWPDLTESSMAEKIDRADKMATINEKHSRAGGMGVVFTDDEMREAVGYDPLSEGDKFKDEPSPEDAAAAAV